MPSARGSSDPGPRPNSRWSRRPRRRSVVAMPTAIVTGASRGLGLALARALAERGWRLVVDAREAGPLEVAAAGLPGAVALAGDVTDAGHPRAPLDAPGGPVDFLRQKRP